MLRCDRGRRRRTGQGVPHDERRRLAGDLSPGRQGAAAGVRRARRTGLGPVGDLPLTHPQRGLSVRDRHPPGVLPGGPLRPAVARRPRATGGEVVLDHRRRGHRRGVEHHMTGLGFTEDQVQRYSRHIILPNVGGAGQRKLLDSKVLVIGAGGLGSPILLYLAAAGIGTIGIVDFDKVDTSNLQRQILHTDADVDRSKVESALDHLRALNPTIEIIGHDTLLTSDNVMAIMEPYDVVIDGTDNFPVRYLVNDATQFLGKPLVYGSIYQFEGQATVFMPGQDAPCYRCLFPSPPPPGTVPSCAEGGVFGVLPGVIGAIQATEAIKLITGEGDSLVGRLLLYDALHMDFQEVKIRWDADCPVCGKEPTITELIDYEQFCGVPARPE